VPSDPEVAVPTFAPVESYAATAIPATPMSAAWPVATVVSYVPFEAKSWYTRPVTVLPAAETRAFVTPARDVPRRSDTATSRRTLFGTEIMWFSNSPARPRSLT
jgi:hypothetical protein